MALFIILTHYSMVSINITVIKELVDNSTQLAVNSTQLAQLSPNNNNNPPKGKFAIIKNVTHKSNNGRVAE